MNWLCKLVSHKFTKRIGDDQVLESNRCYRCGVTPTCPVCGHQP